MTVRCLFVTALGNGLFVQKDHLDAVELKSGKADQGSHQNWQPSLPCYIYITMEGHQSCCISS